jgi:hypothetical protein
MLQQQLPQDILFCVEDAQIVAVEDDYIVTKVEYLPFQRPLLKIRLPPGIKKRSQTLLYNMHWHPPPSSLSQNTSEEIDLEYTAFRSLCSFKAETTNHRTGAKFGT